MNNITLIKYDDDTYYWNLMQDEMPVSYNVMLSKGLWLYNVPLDEITRAVDKMRERKDNVAVFGGDKRRVFIATRNTKDINL